MSNPTNHKRKAKQNGAKPSKDRRWTKVQSETFDAVWGILRAGYTLSDITEFTSHTKSEGWWSFVKNGHMDQVNIRDMEHNSICAAWKILQQSEGKMNGLVKRDLAFNAAFTNAMWKKDDLVKYAMRYRRK